METSFAESIVLLFWPSWKFALAVKKKPVLAGFPNLRGFRGKLVKCSIPQSIASVEVRSSYRSSEMHTDRKSFKTVLIGAPVFNTNSPLHLNPKIAALATLIVAQCIYDLQFYFKFFSSISTVAAHDQATGFHLPNSGWVNLVFRTDGKPL